MLRKLFTGVRQAAASISSLIFLRRTLLTFLLFWLTFSVSSVCRDRITQYIPHIKTQKQSRTQLTRTRTPAHAHDTFAYFLVKNIIVLSLILINDFGKQSSISLHVLHFTHHTTQLHVQPHHHTHTHAHAHTSRTRAEKHVAASLGFFFCTQIHKHTHTHTYSYMSLQLSDVLVQSHIALMLTCADSHTHTHTFNF